MWLQHWENYYWKKQCDEFILKCFKYWPQGYQRKFLKIYTFPSLEVNHFFLYRIFQFSSVQSRSRVQLFVTPWTVACHASLSITNPQSLLKHMSIESVVPSNHLILCRPLLLPSIFPSIRVFSDESVLRIRWPKYWSFSFSISPSNEYSGLISFRKDWLDFQSKGLSRVFSSTTQIRHDYSYIPPHTTPPGHHLRLGSLSYIATSHHLTPDHLCKYVDATVPFISLSPATTV